MRDALAGLGRNLRAGARLALFRRIDRRAFEVDLVAWLLVILMSALLDVVLDGLRAPPGSRFTIAGIGGELYSVGLLMVSSAIIGASTRDDYAFAGLPIVVLASFPLLQVLHAAPAIANLTVDGLPGAIFEVVLFTWMIAVCVRTVLVVSERPARHRGLRALLGGLLLSMPLWWAPFTGPLAGWWTDGDDTPVNEAANPASEPVMAAQAFLLDEALDDLEDARPGVTDLYFVGFAPDARQASYHDEVDEVREVLDERYGTRGRSINLINHATTATDVPFATLSNLRRVLTEVGRAIEPSEDVVMLYLAGGPAPLGGLAAVHPPLDLAPVTPDGVRHLLEEAGIRYAVLVVSSCDAQGWLDALRSDDTAVLVATEACPRRPALLSLARIPVHNALRSRTADTLRRMGAIDLALAQLGVNGTAARLAMGEGIAAQLTRITRGPPLRTARAWLAYPAGGAPRRATAF